MHLISASRILVVLCFCLTASRAVAQCDSTRAVQLAADLAPLAPNTNKYEFAATGLKTLAQLCGTPALAPVVPAILESYFANLIAPRAISAGTTAILELKQLIDAAPATFVVGLARALTAPNDFMFSHVSTQLTNVLGRNPVEAAQAVPHLISYITSNAPVSRRALVARFMWLAGARSDVITALEACVLAPLNAIDSLAPNNAPMVLGPNQPLVFNSMTAIATLGVGGLQVIASVFENGPFARQLLAAQAFEAPLRIGVAEGPALQSGAVLPKLQQTMSDSATAAVTRRLTKAMAALVENVPTAGPAGITRRIDYTRMWYTIVLEMLSGLSPQLRTIADPAFTAAAQRDSYDGTRKTAVRALQRPK